MVPILPTIIAKLTAIALNEVGKRITVAPMMVLKVVFVNPTVMPVSINVNSASVDQYKHTMQQNDTP